MRYIKNSKLNFIREPLVAPFGFKGNSINELWQVICSITDDDDNIGVGLGVQSVLWSDSSVFSALNQNGGNIAMLKVTEYALTLIEGEVFTNPIDIQDKIWDEVYSFARVITNNIDLKKTFVLNALVPVDFALWQLYARQGNIQDVDNLFSFFTNNLCHKQEKLGLIPLITYGTSKEEICSLVKNGCFILKIKIGSSPDGEDDKNAMVEWDCNRIMEIHNLVKDEKTPYTACGYPVYYLDANGRYDTKERLIKLLDFVEKKQIISRIILLEEPFPENSEIDVSDIPITIAGDESVHSILEAKHLINNLGYTAFALKPIAKTLSMTIKIINEAAKSNIPCFCADLTVNPLMLDWNKNIACRIKPLSGIKIGVIESNGQQNYENWEKMKSLHPLHNEAWINPDNGIFLTDERYYKTNGGVLLYPEKYINLF